MPDLNLTTVVTSLVVLLLLSLPFIAARLPRSRPIPSRQIEKAGPGPGFTYALVPPEGDPVSSDPELGGTWQWCLAFIPEETDDGGSEMPPWWAPAPPWDATAERVTAPIDRDFTSDAEALQAVFEETGVYPAAKAHGRSETILRA